MRPVRKSPRDLAPGWPDKPSTDTGAEALRLLALRLREVAGNRSLRQLSEASGVNHAAIGKVMTGESWPDTHTLARLERGLEASLWPVIGASGSHVAAASDVVVGEGAEQVADGDGITDGQQPAPQG